MSLDGNCFGSLRHSRKHRLAGDGGSLVLWQGVRGGVKGVGHHLTQLRDAWVPALGWGPSEGEREREGEGQR